MGSRLFPVGFLDIIRLTGTPAVPMLCLGNTSGYSIRFGPQIALPAMKDRETFIETHLPALVEILKSQILENPDEWELWTRL